MNFGDIYPFLFRDMGYFSKYLKGYVIPGNPLPGPHHKACRVIADWDAEAERFF